MPTIFVVPAAFTLNSPGQYSPGTGPTPAGTPSVRSPAASCSPSTANRSRKSSRACGWRATRSSTSAPSWYAASRPPAGRVTGVKPCLRAASSAAGKPAASESIRLNAAVGRGLCTRNRPGTSGSAKAASSRVDSSMSSWGVVPEPWTTRTGSSPNGPVTVASPYLRTPCPHPRSAAGTWGRPPVRVGPWRGPPPPTRPPAPTTRTGGRRARTAPQAVTADTGVARGRRREPKERRRR